VKKSKRAGLGQEIGFSAPNSCSLPWLVKGATPLCTSKKERRKLDLTSVHYFVLVDHNDSSTDLTSAHYFVLVDHNDSSTDLTSAHYFVLVDHNDSSMWFAISSFHIYAVPVKVLLVGLPKKKTAKLRHLI
jgi:hypothetical protein